MEWNLYIAWFFFALMALLALLGALFTLRGYGVVQIGWLNFSRLKNLRQQKELCTDPETRKSLEAVIGCCEEIRSRWILSEQHLEILLNTHQLVAKIAAIYHPASTTPLAEARLGKVLNAFQELKNKLLALVHLRGVRPLTQFRLRHVFLLSKAWQKKVEWQKSAWGLKVEKYKILFLVKWIYTLFRFLDLTFWVFKMFGYIVQDILLKILLVRWYLIVGELSIQVFSEQEEGPGLPNEDLMENMENIAPMEPPSELSGKAGAVAEASRKNILYHAGLFEWDKIQTAYIQLVEDIARCHHPEARQPLHEVKLYQLIVGVARLSDTLAGIQNKSGWNKLLDIRVSHLLLVKDATDYLKDSEIYNWMQKMQLHRIAKCSHLIYKVIRKKHPAALFQDVVFTLVKEGGKRWMVVAIHDKIAVEADAAYKESETLNR